MIKKLQTFALLSVALPIAILGLLEIGCRALGTADWFVADRLGPGSLNGRKQQLDLEMPRWMTLDSNTRYRAAKGRLDSHSLAWLSLFEPGDKFRVRMIPNTEREIINTFSHLQADRHHPYKVHSNSLGFRGPELARERDPSTFRVLVFGDSSSFGWGVNQNEMFSSILETRLNEKLQRSSSNFSRVEIGNFAIPGDSSEYGRLVFERFAKTYPADMYILGFGANDAKPSPVSHVAQVDRFRSNANLQTLRAILSNSALFETLQGIVTKILGRASPVAGKPDSKVRPAVPKKRYAENLRAMIREASASGAAASAVLTLCTPGDYARRAAKVAVREGVEFVNGQAILIRSIEDIKTGKLYPEHVKDLEARYGSELESVKTSYISSDSCHPNQIGHLIVADSLQPLIEARVFEARLGLQ